MPGDTAIEWADKSWNPVTGCSKVSEGCRYCYAERWSQSLGHSVHGWTARNAAHNVHIHEDRLEVPLTWKKPATIFVNSMSDLFHENVHRDFIADIFAVMAATPHHTFLILTKRAERMAEMLNDSSFRDLVDNFMALRRSRHDWCAWETSHWPIPNVWLGTSAETRTALHKRLHDLMSAPAVVRFLSLEPLLEAIDLQCAVPECSVCGHTLTMSQAPEAGSWRFAGDHWQHRCHDVHPQSGHFRATPGIDWVIVGGESGGPPERRLIDEKRHPKPEALEWVRALRDQCQAAAVPFFFKQWGGITAKTGGHLLDGQTHQDMPRRTHQPALF